MESIQLSEASMKGFNHVWLQLLKIKVKVLYDIAQHKQCNFRELIDEFIPEALENRSHWENDYILDANFFGEHIENEKQKRTISKTKKKIDFVNSLTDDALMPKTIKKKRKKIVIKKNNKGSTNKKKKIIIRKKN